MKKCKLIAILLVFTLLLTSCGISDADTTYFNTAKDNLPIDTTSRLDATDNQWQGEGQCYVLKTYDATINNETQVVLEVIPLQSGIFCVVTPVIISEGYWIQHNGEEIYSSPNYFYAAAASDDGIWILENDLSGGESNYSLLLISQKGEIQESINLSEKNISESYRRTLICLGDNLYLISGKNEIVVIGTDGNYVCSIALPDETFYPVAGNDGQIYLVQPTDDGNQLYLVDINSFSFSKSILCNNGNVYSGADDYFLLLKNSNGLYTIMQNGNIEPIIIWAECNISINGLFSIYSIEENQFLLMSETGPFILHPADFSEIERKTTLQIATISQDNTLKKLVSDFNNKNLKYNVQILDYSDNGTFEAEVALTRLNTEILSGHYPDMICFSHINPYPFISKNLLVNLKDFFDQDGEINIEDIAIANALDYHDGIYFISGVFNFETLVGRYSDFGDQYGWTLAEYLSLEKTVPDEIETIHNMTKESFINRIVSRYIRTAIDWDNCTCNFNTPEFSELLEAGNSIRETPENSANMTYGYGPTKVGEGSRIASLSWVNTVWKLTYEEQMAGCKLSFIGWPTVDGSCGSDAYLIEPIGIINQGNNTDGCWEFIKFTLLCPDMNAENLPTYIPHLQAKVDAAKEDEELPVQMSDSDAERLFSLISEIKNVAIYDETVLDIIHKESASFFNGDKTSEEAAKIIQSKASIYVAEQS